jgi:hypothetical protein
MLNKRTLSIRLLLIGIIFSPLSMAAQVAKEVTTKYPASVVCRLYAIACKTNIPVKKQMVLADYFLQQDKQANKALSNGAPLADVANLYAVNTTYLKKILSPLEFNDYIFSADKTTSQFIKALKFRNELGLNEKQVNELLTLADKPHELRATANNEIPPTINRYEGEQLVRILTGRQYKSYITLLVAPWADSDNLEAWLKLKRYGFVNPADSGKVCKDNLNYFMKSDGMDAETSNSISAGKTDSVRFSFFSFKPACLMKLDMVNGTLPQTQFTDILKIRKVLWLNNRQVDTLISDISQLERLRGAYKAQHPYMKYDATPFEAKKILDILNTVQYNAYLREKNKDNAMVNEKKTWNRLKQYGLIKEGVDSVQLSKDLIKYHLDILMANERFHNDDSPQNAEARAAAEKNKPFILKQLDTNMKTTAAKDNSKKALAW